VSTEIELLDLIDFSDVVQDFAAAKSSKNYVKLGLFHYSGISGTNILCRPTAVFNNKVVQS